MQHPTPRDVPEGRRSLPDRGGSSRLLILSLINFIFLASDTDLHATPRHCSAQASLFLSNLRPTCYSQCCSHATVSVAIALRLILGETRVEVLLVVCFHVGVLSCKVACIMYRVSCIVYRVSCIVYHISCIMYRVSCIVYHVSCIVYHVSCIVYHVCCEFVLFVLSI